MIKWAAIKRKDGVIIKGKDHSECILKNPLESTFEDIQGFVTSEEIFVSRKEAGKIAWNSQQIQEDPEGGIICSEEIWLWGNCYYDETEGYKFKEK